MMLFHLVPRNVSPAPPFPLPLLALVNCSGGGLLTELRLLSCSFAISLTFGGKATQSGFQSIFIGLN